MKSSDTEAARVIPFLCNIQNGSIRETERRVDGWLPGVGLGEQAGEEEVGSDCLVGTGFYSGVMTGNALKMKRSDGCPTVCTYQMRESDLDSAV